jgi:hypothetical protein
MASPEAIRGRRQAIGFGRLTPESWMYQREPVFGGGSQLSRSWAAGTAGRVVGKVAGNAGRCAQLAGPIAHPLLM